MSVKTDSELTSLNNSRLPDNNVRFISAEKVRSQIQDLIDSKISKKGGFVIDAEVGYSTPIAPSSDYGFATKKYVDDSVASIDLSAYAPIAGGFSFTGNVNGVTPTQLTYLNSLTSNVQAQLDSKIELDSLSGSAGVSYDNTTGVISADASKVPYFSGGISGTPSSGTYLRGDGSWAAVTSGISSVSGTTNRITSSGGATPIIDISSSYAGQSSITTLGTIGIGTWQGTAIADSYIASAATWNAKMTNPMTTLGDIIYENATPTPARLAGNTTTTRQFLSQTGNGTISAAPIWSALALSDMPVFTGYVAGSGVVSSTDRAFDAIQKLDGLQRVQNVGAFYTEGFASGTIATNYTKVGSNATFTQSTGKITIAAGVGNYSEYIYLKNYQTSSENFTFDERFSVDTINTAGIAFGIVGISQNFIIALDTTTSSASVIKVTASGSVLMGDSNQGALGSLSVSANDVIRLKAIFSSSNLTVTAYNEMTFKTLVWTYNFITSGSFFSYTTFNHGYKAVFSVGGSHSLLGSVFIEDNPVSPDILVMGDSIYHELGTVDSNNSFFSILRNNFNGNFTRFAQGGNTVAGFNNAATINMVALHKPRRVLLGAGTNDITNVATLQTNYAALVSSLQGLGAIVDICLLLDKSANQANIATFNAWLISTYGSTNLIFDFNSVIAYNTNQTWFTDGTHPNKHGNDILAKVLISGYAGILSKKNSYFKSPLNTDKQFNFNASINAGSSASNALLTTDTSIVLANKMNWGGAGYAFIVDASNNGASEIVKYSGSDATSIKGLTRGVFGTTAIAIGTNTNVNVRNIYQFSGSGDTSAPAEITFGIGNNNFTGRVYNGNAILTPSDGYVYNLLPGANSFRLTSPSGTNSVFNITKASSTDTSIIQWDEIVSGVVTNRFRATHANDGSLAWTKSGVTYQSTDSSGNLTFGTTSSVFRLTNAGSDVTSRIAFSPARSVTSGINYYMDVTNGLVFGQGNGTRNIAGAAFKPINLTATAGSEAMDLGVYTQSAGAAIALRATFGASSLTLIEAYNLALGTTTGTKIGTATNQKLGFWNATPVIQPTTAITAASFVANTSGTLNDSATYGGYTIGQIVAALKQIGVLA